VSLTPIFSIPIFKLSLSYFFFPNMMKFTSVFVAAVIAQGASAQGCSPLELIYGKDFVLHW
jgi:hypothetical protein